MSSRGYPSPSRVASLSHISDSSEQDNIQYVASVRVDKL